MVVVSKGLVLNLVILVILRKLKRLRRSTRLLWAVVSLSDLFFFCCNVPMLQVKRVSLASAQIIYAQDRLSVALRCILQMMI